MKVQCDVCKGEEEAAVFCCADEAALCGPCDGRVHSANKLAGKHRRLSLVHPDSPEQFPFCDICKENPALLFCQEDRAILCRDCDAPIHDVNDLTRKHSRFLLTGIRLSPFAAPATPATPEATASSSDTPSSVAASTTTTASADGEHPPATVTKSNQHSRHSVVDRACTQHKKPRTAAKEMTDKNSKAIAVTAAGFGNGNMVVQDVGLCSRASAAAAASATATTTGGSSISEYLMKELPGWHVEDLLLESCPTAHPAACNFSKMLVQDLTPFREEDMGAVFPPEDGWEVLAPLRPVHGQQQHHAMAMGMGGELTALASRQFQQQHHQHHAWTGDDGFTVPELVAVHHKPPPSYKRSSPSSWCISS